MVKILFYYQEQTSVAWRKIDKTGDDNAMHKHCARLRMINNTFLPQICKSIWCDMGEGSGITLWEKDKQWEVGKSLYSFWEEHCTLNWLSFL